MRAEQDKGTCRGENLPGWGPLTVEESIAISRKMQGLPERSEQPQPISVVEDEVVDDDKKEK